MEAFNEQEIKEIDEWLAQGRDVAQGIEDPEFAMYIVDIVNQITDLHGDLRVYAAKGLATILAEQLELAKEEVE